jgi:hypothetical protein
MLLEDGRQFGDGVITNLHTHREVCSGVEGRIDVDQLDLAGVLL